MVPSNICFGEEGWGISCLPPSFDGNAFFWPKALSVQWQPVRCQGTDALGSCGGVPGFFYHFWKSSGLFGAGLLGYKKMSQLCSLAVGMLLNADPWSRDYYQMVNRSWNSGLPPWNQVRYTLGYFFLLHFWGAAATVCTFLWSSKTLYGNRVLVCIFQIQLLTVHRSGKETHHQNARWGSRGWFNLGHFLWVQKCALLSQDYSCDAINFYLLEALF